MQYSMDVNIHQVDRPKKRQQTQEMERKHGRRWNDDFFCSILRSFDRSLAIIYRELKAKEQQIMVMEPPQE